MTTLLPPRMPSMEELEEYYQRSIPVRLGKIERELKEQRKILDQVFQLLQKKDFRKYTHQSEKG